jgi:hypothetical protein
MARKVAAGLAVLALLAGGLLGAALHNANRLVARFRPDLERLASEAAGAEVTLGKIEASVLPSARLHLDRVTVGGTQGLVLDDLVLHLRILPLLRGRLDVVTLGLESPRMTLVWDAQGVRLEGLRRRGEAVTGPTPRRPATSTAAAAPVDLVLRQVEITDATVELKDIEGGGAWTVSELSLQAALDAGPERARVLRLEVGGVAQGEVPFAVAGADLAYDMRTGVASIPPLGVEIAGQRLTAGGTVDARGGTADLHLASGGVDLGTLGPLLDLAPEAVRALDPRGAVTLDLRVRLDPDGTYKVSGAVTLADVALLTAAGALTGLGGRLDLGGTAALRTVSTSGLEAKLGGQAVKVTMAAETAADTATLRDGTLAAFAGTTRARGTLGIESGRFSTHIGAEGIDVARLAAALRPDTSPGLTGTLSGFRATLGGTLGEHLERSLGGGGSLVLENGRLVGLNLAADVLKALRDIPFVAGPLDRAVPADLRPLVEEKDTVIGRLGTDFTVAEGVVRLSNLALTNPAFTFAGGGQVGFDSRLDLEGTLSFTPGLSSAVAQRVKELRVVFDPQGRLAVPLRIRGAPPRLTVTPNVNKLAEAAARKVMREPGQALKGLLGADGFRLPGL